MDICVFECMSMSVYETECKYMSLSIYECKCVGDCGYACAFEHECVYTQHACVCLCMYMPCAACLGSCTFASLCAQPEAETLGAEAAVARAVLAPPVVIQEAVEVTLIHICRVGRETLVRAVQWGGPPTTCPASWAHTLVHSPLAVPAS